MSDIKWGQYGSFSGVYHLGDKHSPVNSLPEDHNFLMAAFWLLSMAECEGRYGVINMKDGTGVTAGLFQAAGCLPRYPKEQGPLFKLLWRLDHTIPLDYFAAYRMMKAAGWTLGSGGVLLDASGRPVEGREFRAVVSPPDGKTPAQGPHRATAEAWCVAFRELFEFGMTHRVQVTYGIEVLVKRVCRYRAKNFINGLTLEDVAFGGNAQQPEPFRDEPHADLAHAVMLSFFINAPAWATDAYTSALKRAWPTSRVAWQDAGRLNEVTHSEQFARWLLHYLTRRDKWDDDREGSRYKRTRTAAMTVPTRWPKKLFQKKGIMAADLPG